MNLDHLLKSLLNLPRETEWLEFKHNNDAPEEIGEYLSALANSAALHGRDAGYIVWGIEDVTKRVVGTTANPRQKKIGNEELENWLAHLLSPRVDFRFHEWEHQGRKMVLLQVQPAVGSPLAFKGTEWIRVGSLKKKLKDHPGKEKELWQALARLSFEKGIAAPSATGDEVLAWLDYPKYFELAGLNLPANRAGILERLATERFIVPKGGDHFDITNLGGILFAKSLNQFEGLARKALRVIQYQANDRLATIKEHVETKGYAASFEAVVDYINDQLPSSEEIGRALRREVRMFPKIAVRELVANALIHQDFALTGTGPMVEIFTDRIEITNPGPPLIDPLRFIDEPPQSRNEALAAMMRRLNICEERGTGIDKVIAEIELYQLPAPDFQATPKHTRAFLFAPRKLNQMDAADRVRACYQHACLCWVVGKAMTNATLRGRLGIAEHNYSIASRIIAEAIKAGLVRHANPDNKSRKHAQYLPFWLM